MYIFLYLYFYFTCTLTWYSFIFIVSVYMYSLLNLFGYWTLNKRYYYNYYYIHNIYKLHLYYFAYSDISLKKKLTIINKWDINQVQDMTVYQIKC